MLRIYLTDEPWMRPSALKNRLTKLRTWIIRKNTILLHNLLLKTYFRETKIYYSIPPPFLLLGFRKKKKRNPKRKRKKRKILRQRSSAVSIFYNYVIYQQQRLHLKMGPTSVQSDVPFWIFALPFLFFQ